MHKHPFCVGIDLSDNDFGHTVEPFLRLLLEGVTDRHPSKAEVVRLFNLAAPGLYWLCQNRLRYSDSPADQERIRAYLQITEKSVWVGEEVRTRFQELTHTAGCNGSFWFTMDGSTVHVL